MKTIKNRLKSLAAAAILTGLAVNFNACSEQRPLSSQEANFSSEKGLKVAGQLPFAPEAIAMHPQTGQVYYLTLNKTSGIWQVGVWNPETNTNTILPCGTTFQTAAKLAFHPDGTLFGLNVNSSNLKELYTIDTTTGAWTYATLSESLKLYRDTDFSADGLLYSSGRASSPNLRITDITTGTVTTLAQAQALK